MPTSLKALCDKVMGVSGFQLPTAYFGGLNPDDVQMGYVANAASDTIREAMPQIIRKLHTITLTAATSYPLPSDFLGYVPDTAYTFGRLDPVLLPVTATQWNNWLATNNPAGMQVRARFLAGTFQIIEPSVGSQISFEYFSNAPWTDSTGLIPKEQADDDTDLCLIDRRLMETAIQWRWKKEKGLPDWELDLQDYQQQLGAWRARDQGAITLFICDPSFPNPSPQTNLWVNP